MLRILKSLFIILVTVIVVYSCNSGNPQENLDTQRNHSPKIINIVNFIRQCEPRIDWITEEVLFETVVSQVDMMTKYKLTGTFLLQYDALIDPRYQDLLQNLPKDQFEIGAWWEIPQPLVEESGYTWRGRYPWDWHADVGFATGYKPEERESLVDTYMAKFKSVFGEYPKSVGSWFIDAHTLNYMYEKYSIAASCNCKDQIGTDGYTLWGGYWNQAYYPSKKNAYMPAQNADNQIPVPIFRMLGSDPIHQYDNGLGGNVQRVVSLEPVYSGGGGNQEWCNWYYSEFVNGPAMAFAYTQTGQENSFTWKRMKAGFDIQFPIIAQLLEEKKIELKTLGETGDWFKQQFEVTPATAVTVLSDHTEKDLKTVWFNSRFYRANLLWEQGTLRFRDIHLFDENLESDYLTQKGESTQCNYYTLPLVDGFQWSSTDIIAGLRFKTLKNDSVVDILGGDPLVNDKEEGQLLVTWKTTDPTGEIDLLFDESGIKISAKGKALRHWFMELNYDLENDFPLLEMIESRINCSYEGFKYSVSAIKGRFNQSSSNSIRIYPEKNKVQLDLNCLDTI